MERETMEQMNEEMLAAAQDAGEITAQELGADIAEAAQEHNAQAEADERMSDIREGIGELFEDGWTAAELAALSQDETAREAIAAGKSVARAACAYLRAKGAAKKRGVPTARAIAAGEHEASGASERMTDEEFDAFSRKARLAMMEGKKVRM